MKLAKRNSGFTLIEILVVIGIIAVLATIVIIAINPARQFAQARDTQRTANVQAILNAVGQNLADNKGVFNCGAVNLPTTSTAVSDPLTSVPTDARRIASGNAAGTVDLSCLVPTYISAFPFDPSRAGANWTSASNYDTGYFIIQDNSPTGGARITVFSDQTEPSLNRTNFIKITR